MDVLDRWLATKGQNSRRAYVTAIRQFREFLAARSMDLHDASTVDVSAWLTSLEDRGLARATVEQRRMLLQSFYSYACDSDGWPANPVLDVRARHVTPYGRSRYPSTEQVQRLLEVIPGDTLQGKRDLAVLLGLFVLARRINEWVPIRWRDVHVGSDGAVTFRFTAKGGWSHRQAIPPDLWRIVEDYERAAGRWPLKSADPLFIAHSDASSRLPNTPEHIPGERPITAGYYRAVMRRYARQAGIPEDVAHPHGLRHAGARWRREAGASIPDLQKLLSHRSVTTTLIYTEGVLDQPRDAIGDMAVSAVLPRVLRLK